MADPTDPSKAVSDIKNVAAASTQADAAVGQLDQALTSMFDTLRDRSDEIGKLATSLGSLVLTNSIYSSELYKTVIQGMEQAARVPRAIASEIAGGNILAGAALNEQAKVLFEDATRSQTELQTRMISFGFDSTGKEISRHATLLYKDAAELGKAYYETVLKESKLYSAGVKALNEETAYDMKESTDLAMRGLGLDAAAVREIYEREYAHTGQITGKYIENFSATILAGEKLTGLSKKALTEDVSRMLGDFNLYGKMSESQMVVLSKTVHDLGVDLQTAAESAQKFMSMEGAAQAASNISALTGVVIDSQKLFYLANTDQAAYLKEVRTYLRDMDLEHRDRVTQNAIAQELGLKSTSDALAIANSQLDAQGNINKEMIDKLAASDEYRGEKLKEQERQASALATLAAMKPEEQAKSLQAIKDLAGGTEELGKAIESFNNRLISSTKDVAPQMISAGKEVSAAFSAGLDTSTKIISNLQGGLKDFFESGGMKNVIEHVRTSLATLENTIMTSKFIPRSVPEIWQKGFLDGINIFKLELDKELDAIVASLTDRVNQMSNVIKDKGKLKTEVELQINPTLAPITAASPPTAATATPQPPVSTAPTTPTVAGTPSTTPEAPASLPVSATAETTDMRVKLHFDIDGDKMNNMIDLRIQEVLAGNIVFNRPVASKYMPGTYRIVFEESRT